MNVCLQTHFCNIGKLSDYQIIELLYESYLYLGMKLVISTHNPEKSISEVFLSLGHARWLHFADTQMNFS